MAGYKIPGPLCAEKLPWLIEDGTLARMSMPPPGVPCQSIAGQTAKPPMLANEPNLDFLFLQCSIPDTGLAEEDFKAAAEQLGVDIASVKAVAEVETSGQAFDQTGRPRILFERHYFHRLTEGRFSAKHPDISNSLAGGYGKFSEQYGKLERAYRLDQSAALMSASWGKFQIMGSHYRTTGFPSVKAFVLALASSEVEHLNVFVNFVSANETMLTALRGKDWGRFAKAYNGAGYKKNRYDEKMAEAYNRFSSSE